MLHCETQHYVLGTAGISLSYWYLPSSAGTHTTAHHCTTDRLAQQRNMHGIQEPATRVGAGLLRCERGNQDGQAASDEPENQEALLARLRLL